MIVFLPIRPLYAHAIMQQTKRWEFRRTQFRRKPTVAVIYASAPVKKALGYVQIRRVIEASPKDLWDYCKEHAGIDLNAYLSYYSGRSTAICLQLGEVIRFLRPMDPRHVLSGFIIPQSFCYLGEDDFHKLVTVCQPAVAKYAGDHVTRSARLSHLSAGPGRLRSDG